MIKFVDIFDKLVVFFIKYLFDLVFGLRKFNLLEKRIFFYKDRSIYLLLAGIAVNLLLDFSLSRFLPWQLAHHQMV